MPRHIVLRDRKGARVVLDEDRARNEDELQRRLRDDPELLPIEEFGLGENAMIVGRETVLPSGKPDLLALAPTGDLIIVEMKTGPDNSDFRRALAQLIDYGSDLWGMSLEQFESDVSGTYFAGPHCPAGSPTKNAASLESAIQLTWPTAEDPVTDVLARLQSDLKAGAFTYVLAAQSLTPHMERSMAYMNEAMERAQFYGVELVKFLERDGTIQAFEGRTVVRPAPTKQGVSQKVAREELLTRFEAPERNAAAELLEIADKLALTVFIGSSGASVKAHLPDRDTPLSVVWFYPPGSSGYKGSKELTLGYDVAAVEDLPASRRLLSSYVDAARTQLTGTQALGSPTMDAVTVPWHLASGQLGMVTELLSGLVAPSEVDGEE